MTFEDDTFTADDGVGLYTCTWRPSARPKGLVHIAHGLGEHCRRYDWTAEKLAESGFLVYAHDHRGHGSTAKDFEKLGFFATSNGWDRAIQDLRLLLEAEKRANPGLPMILFGHSMGSFMAQHMMYMHGDRFDACVLSGSTGAAGLRVQFLWTLAQLERWRVGSRGRSIPLHRMALADANRAFEPRRTDFDWLSREPGVVERYVQDPYCGFIGTVRLWLDLIEGVLFITRPSNRRRAPKGMPIYIFAGTKDPVGSGCKSLENLLGAYRQNGMTDVSHKFYPEGRHEMLNETNREEVIADLMEWLNSTVTKLAG